MRTITSFMISALLLVAATAMASSYYIIKVDGNEAVEKATRNVSKNYTPDPAKNEYALNYTFPTNEMMYWKKVGTDWIAMSPAEQDAVNTAKKDAVTDEVVEDAINDAIIRTIAEAINQNAKTYDAVKAIFTSEVDPKKADKKEKNK